MCTYFDNFQLVAFEIRTVDRLENGTDADRMQNEIVVVALKEITLIFLVWFLSSLNDSHTSYFDDLRFDWMAKKSFWNKLARFETTSTLPNQKKTLFICLDFMCGHECSCEFPHKTN